jgi:adenosine deaminase
MAIMPNLRRPFLALAVALFSACAQVQAQPRAISAQSHEMRAARAYEAAIKAGPLTTYAFLLPFPKGADLHMHLSGAVYAETFIRDAGEDGLCVDTVALRFARPPCTGNNVPAAQLSGNVSGANQDLYDRLVDSFSMRSFVPYAGWSGHDQFFATFGRYGGVSKSHLGEWVDEIASRAASQNEQYLELMQTPTFSHAAEIGKQVGWPAPGQPVDFARIRQALLDRGLRDEVPADMEDVRTIENSRRAIEYCGTPQATAACKVQVRFIYQILRGNPPEQVFAQTLLGFETVERSIESGDPGFVGINFVQPEDGYLSMRDYALQMRMVGYLHSVYPKVHISLHAGELAPGLVPPEGLRFHIRQAVEIAHAERIGHGVDLMYENGGPELLKEMARRHVMVEINLSSNEGILGVSGVNHPFPLYRAAHVPVALSTDDEGVSRIELTHEYTRAARDYHLTYSELKQLARTAMEHNFLPGASLWAEPDDFARPAPACRGQVLGSEKPSAECHAFLAASQKAAAQWELERRFNAFEAAF